MKQKISISCSKANLAEIRNFVSQILSDLSVHDLEAHKVILAIDEVCANLIIHSNNCNPSHNIDVSIAFIEDQRLVVEIKDKGLSFNYQEYKEPNLNKIVSGRKKGGLGLLLVKRIMDKVEFSKEKNCNICRLTKKIGR